MFFGKTGKLENWGQTENWENWGQTGRFLTVQPALITVQPSISIFHCKTLNNLSEVCHSLVVFVKSNPRPFTLSPEGSSDRRFRPGRKGLASLRFASAVFLSTDHCPLTCPDPVRPTPHSCSKSFSCNTYRSPRKCCKQKTYAPAKPFRCNTYKKQGAPPPPSDRIPAEISARSELLSKLHRNRGSRIPPL